MCVDKNASALVDTTAAPAASDAINHNLGEKPGPYAITIPGLDDFIGGLMAGESISDDYVMRVDLRYGCVSPPFTINTQETIPRRLQHRGVARTTTLNRSSSAPAWRRNACRNPAPWRCSVGSAGFAAARRSCKS